VSRFPGKKLPPRWVYVPSRQEVRDLVRDSPGDFRRVEFDGTGSGPSAVGLLLGYLERRVADRAWCFYLRLWGAPESAVGEHRDAMAAAALAAIEGSVAECLASAPPEVAKPTQLLLRFAVGPDGVVPRYSTKPVDRYSFSAGNWWERPGGAEPDAAPDRARD
jgi:hypothetical protein